jgi:hypothetical protein
VKFQLFQRVTITASDACPAESRAVGRSGRVIGVHATVPLAPAEQDGDEHVRHALEPWYLVEVASDQTHLVPESHLGVERSAEPPVERRPASTP